MEREVVGERGTLLWTTGTVEGVVETVLFVGERTEYQVKVREQGVVLVYGKREHVVEGEAVRLKVHADSVSVWPV